MQVAFYLFEVVFGDGSDEADVVVDKSCGGDGGGDSAATLVDLQQNHFEGFGLDILLIFFGLERGQAEGADEPAG